MRFVDYVMISLSWKSKEATSTRNWVNYVTNILRFRGREMHKSS
jgi:hypothetical protein